MFVPKFIQKASYLLFSIYYSSSSYLRLQAYILIYTEYLWGPVGQFYSRLTATLIQCFSNGRPQSTSGSRMVEVNHLSLPLTLFLAPHMPWKHSPQTHTCSHFRRAGAAGNEVGSGAEEMAGASKWIVISEEQR